MNSLQYLFILLAGIVLILYSCMITSGKESRREERSLAEAKDPCNTCSRRAKCKKRTNAVR